MVLCQPCGMGVPDVIIELVGASNFERTCQFLIEWVSDDEAAAREHLADHADGAGASLVAVRDHGVIGIVTIRWQSNYPRFRDHGIPLVHQLALAGGLSGGSVSQRCSWMQRRTLPAAGVSRYSASPSGYLTSMAPPSGSMPSAATFRMAGEHAVARCR